MRLRICLAVSVRTRPAEPGGETPAEFGGRIEGDVAKWVEVYKATGLGAE